MNQDSAARQDPLRLFFTEFLTSAESTLERLTGAHFRLRSDPADGEALHVLVRGYHALKGNSSFFEDAAITLVACAAEEVSARIEEDGGPCPPDVLDVLDRALAHLRALVAECGRRAESVTRRPIDDEMAHALELAVPFDAERSYVFWGTDVTEPVRLLAGVADRTEVDAITARRVALAAEGLARLAREADVHDVARPIEAAARALLVITDAGPTVFEPAPVRLALRALAPFLERATPTG